LLFGTVLSPGGLDGHLAQIRARQRQYRAGHPADVARVTAVRDAELRVLNSPSMASRYALAAPSEE
jgi:hypothetical protein